MTPLIDRVLAIHQALEDADLPHALGGALALAFHIAEPRATRDIDINIFMPPAREAFSALPSGVEWTQRDVDEAIDRGQVRIFWDDTPVDLFFSTHAFHEDAALGVVEVPFEGHLIPVLGATALAVFKAFFDRTRDWADIEAMLDARSLDVPRVLGWLVELLGPEDPRVVRLRAVSQREPPETEPVFRPPTKPK